MKKVDYVPHSDLIDFGDEEQSPKTEWVGMPEFNQPDNGPWRSITVHFEDEAGLRDFAKRLGYENITAKTKSAWYPWREKNRVADLFYCDGEQELPDITKCDASLEDDYDE